MTPKYWKQATLELTRRDPVLEKLVSAYGSATLRTRGDAFATLARAIVGQQISTKAANSVWQKLVVSVGKMNPEAIANSNEPPLRSCGLSGRKVIYLKDLASHFLSGSIVPRVFVQLEDEAVIDELTKIKGIGRWTAEMFLIFYLTRPNVLPLNDIGLLRAINLHYGNGKPLSERKLYAITRNWAPWRSVATWYMWRSLDPIAVEY